MTNKNNSKIEDLVIVLHTPLEFNFESLFKDYSIKFKPKVEFIIHQCNQHHREGGYKLNSKNHQWLLGIKPTELADILRVLKNSGIIKLADNYSPGNTASVYNIVKPFDTSESRKSQYRADDFQFLTKWVMDDYVVKNASTSKFTKKVFTNTSEIAEIKEELSNLKNMFQSVLMQLQSMNNLQSESIT